MGVSGTPVRIMVDTHVIDAILADGSLFEAMRDASTCGRLSVLVTHVQVDEVLDLAPRDLEAAKRLVHTLLAIGAREVNTHGFVLDLSRLDLADLADDKGSGTIESFTGGNASHLEDALIAATADGLGVPLVTDEARRGRYRRTYPGLRLLTTTELRALVDGLGAEP